MVGARRRVDWWAVGIVAASAVFAWALLDVLLAVGGHPELNASARTARHGAAFVPVLLYLVTLIQWLRQPDRDGAGVVVVAALLGALSCTALAWL